MWQMIYNLLVTEIISKQNLHSVVTPRFKYFSF